MVIFPFKKNVFFLYPSRQNNQHASKNNRLKSIERTNVGHHLKPLTTLPAPPTYMRKNYHIPTICKNHPKTHQFGGFVATPLTLPTSICLDLFSSVIISPIFPELYPLVICYIAIENDHRNSGVFPLIAWWIFP